MTKNQGFTLYSEKTQGGQTDLRPAVLCLIYLFI